MHMYAKCDLNIPYGSRVMSSFTNLPWAERQMDRHTYIMIGLNFILFV